jgi:prepilin-type N-terminal cleavage/methylation domain-containing protein
MTTARKHLRSQRGFTLVEAIIVMVLTGVLAGVMVLFIRQPVQNYVDAAGRAGLTDTADLALRRMARELRSALPNSIRTTFTMAYGTCSSSRSGLAASIWRWRTHHRRHPAQLHVDERDPV